MYFFKHKMRPAAFLCRFNIPIDMRGWPQYFFAGIVVQVDMVVVQHGKLVIFQKVYIPRIGKQGGHIACKKVFFFTRAHNQRAVFADGDYSVGKVHRNNAERITAFELGNRPHRCT